MLLCPPGGSLHPLPLPSLAVPHDPSLCPLGDLVEKTPCTWNSSRVCECRPGMVCVTSAANSCARCVTCPIFPPGMVTKCQREQSTPPTKGQRSGPLQLCLSPAPTGQMTFNPSCLLGQVWALFFLWIVRSSEWNKIQICHFGKMVLKKNPKTLYHRWFFELFFLKSLGW